MCRVNSHNDDKLAYYAFSLTNAHAGSQHEEKLLLTNGGRASVHLVSDCQKYYSSTIIIFRLPEKEKSQAQGHLLRLVIVGVT